MSAVPLSETAAKRRIGDILLDHGFVTAEELAEATLEQERTQQPLGQILVGRGSITRLELASALAEQWADPAASISSTSRAAPDPAPAPSAQDEAQYAARLQEAVADLARKVQSNQPLEGIDERVDDLSRRIEGTLARTQHIEAAVATLAESLEGVTTGVEEAFYALQAGTNELVTDLARIDETVRALAARETSPGDVGSLADIEELRAAVAGLRDGTAETAELREQLDVMALRLDAVAEPERAVEDVVRRVEQLGEQLDELRSTTHLDELRSAVHALEERSEAYVQITDRLDRIETQPSADHLREELEGQAHALADLRTTVGEIIAQPTETPELGARLDRVEANLESSTTAAAELGTRIDALSEEVREARDGERRVDDALAGIERLNALLEKTATDVDAVTAALGPQDGPSVDRRIEDLVEALDGLRAEVEGIASSARRTEADAERVHALEHRLKALEQRTADDVVTPDALARALESHVDDVVLGRLETLEARVESLARDEPDEGVVARLDELENARAGDVDTINVLALAMDRIRHDLAQNDQSSHADPSEMLDAVSVLSERIAALEITAATTTAPADDGSEVRAELERLRLVLERIGLHLGEHDRALADFAPDRRVEERLQELTVLVHDLAQSQQAAATQQAAGFVPPLSRDVDSLLQRVEEAEAASQTDSEKLMSRLERMASSIDWRLQQLESGVTDEPE
jgi:hypothetical protein